MNHQLQLNDKPFYLQTGTHENGLIMSGPLYIKFRPEKNVRSFGNNIFQMYPWEKQMFIYLFSFQRSVLLLTVISSG